MIGPVFWWPYPEVDEDGVRIDDTIKECTFYIYESRVAAMRGEAAGGTGFLVGVRLKENRRAGIFYVITNAHIIRGLRRPTLRLNSDNGTLLTIETKREEWKLHPHGDDLAARKVETLGQYQVRAVPDELFITRRIIAENDIGPGDEVFMIGRFVGHEGRKKNLPSVRFGNISAMPEEPIRNKGEEQEAFLVECRSIGGYSGSPVFTWIPAFAPRPPWGAFRESQRGPWFLGIDCGHIQTTEELRTVKGQRKIGSVTFNSAMAVVIPAWRLRLLLDSDDFVKDREMEDRLLTERKNTDTISLD